MNIQSYASFQASAAFSSFSPVGRGGGNSQMMALLQQMMTVLQSQLGMGRGPRGFCPAPPRPHFGGNNGQCGPQGFGGNPGLSNFCGGNGFGGNGLNLNLNGLPPNANVNINIGGQQCPPRQCGGQLNGNFNMNGNMQCHGGKTGQLSQKGKGKPISYTTRGGYQVTVNKDKVSIKDAKGNEIRHRGDPHEDLNGKHIKDWKGKQRSIVLDDGTKITMSAKGPKGVTEHTSIYDGRQNVQINNKKNEIEHHSMNGYDTMQREMAQYDGETARFSTNRQGDAMYYNVYNEAQNGVITRMFDWLAQASGGKVHDMFDDPTHKRT